MDETMEQMTNCSCTPSNTCSTTITTTTRGGGGRGGRRSSSNFEHAFFYPLSHCFFTLHTDFSWASPAHHIPGGFCSLPLATQEKKVMDGWMDGWMRTFHFSVHTLFCTLHRI